MDPSHTLLDCFCSALELSLNRMRFQCNCCLDNTAHDVLMMSIRGWEPEFFRDGIVFGSNGETRESDVINTHRTLAFSTHKHAKTCR